MEFYPEKLNDIISEKGVTRDWLCNNIQVQRSNLWKWLKGHTVPREKNVRKIAEVLNISVSEISSLLPLQNKEGMSKSDFLRSWLTLTGLQTQNERLNTINKALDNICKITEEINHISLFTEALISSFNLIFYIKNLNLEYTIVNKAFLDTLSLRDDYRIEGKTDFDFFPSKEANYNTDEDTTVLKDKNPIITEGYIPGTRKKKWGIINKVPIFSNDNKLIGMIGTFIDITDRKKMEKQLDTLLKGLDCISGKICVWTGKYVDTFHNKMKLYYYNQSLVELMGYIPDQNLYFNINSIENIVHPDSLDEFLFERKKQENQKKQHYTIKLKTKKNGENIWIDYHYYYDEQYQFCMGIMVDITILKLMQEENKILNFGINKVTEGFAVRAFDDNNSYSFINNGMCLIYEHAYEKLKSGGLNYIIKNCIHPDDRSLLIKNRDSEIWPEEIIYRIITPLNDTKIIHCSSVVRKYYDRNYHCSVVRDITKEVEANKIKELLKINVDVMNQAISIFDINTKKLIYANEAHERIFGYSNKEIFSWSREERINNLFHNSDRESAYKCFIENENKNDQFVGDYRIIRKDGELRWVRFNSKYITFDDKKCRVIVFSDITGEKKFREQTEYLYNFFGDFKIGVAAYDVLSGKFLFVNEFIAEVTGSTVDRILKNGINCWIENFIHSDFVEKERYYRRNLNYPPTRELKIITENKEEKWIRITTFIPASCNSAKNVRVSLIEELKNIT